MGRGWTSRRRAVRAVAAVVVGAALAAAGRVAVKPAPEPFPATARAAVEAVTAAVSGGAGRVLETGWTTGRPGAADRADRPQAQVLLAVPGDPRAARRAAAAALARLGWTGPGCGAAACLLHAPGRGDVGLAVAPSGPSASTLTVTVYA